LSNVPGALDGIVSKISGYNLNIYHIETCSRRGDECSLFIAVDFTDKDVFPEKLLKKFRKVEYVKDVVISPKFKNVIYPSRFYPMDLGGIRSIIAAEGNMRGIIEGIKEEMGEEIGNAFLYRIGYEIGRKAYKLFAEKLGIESFDEGIKIIRALARGAGWCDIKEVIRDDNNNNNNIIIRVEHIWECESQRGKVNKPASYLVKGAYVGFFKEFLNIDVKAKETKCIALGDPYCEFEITIS